MPLFFGRRNLFKASTVCHTSVGRLDGVGGKCGCVFHAAVLAEITPIPSVGLVYLPTFPV